MWIIDTLSSVASWRSFPHLIANDTFTSQKIFYLMIKDITNIREKYIKIVVHKM